MVTILDLLNTKLHRLINNIPTNHHTTESRITEISKDYK